MPVGMVNFWQSHLYDETYRAVNARLGFLDTPPSGLLLHSAGRSGTGGWLIHDVWESRRHAETFMSEQLVPAWAAITGHRGRPPEQTITYEVDTLLSVP